MPGYQAWWKRKNRSFTIVELLVAITILATILGLFYSTWWLSVKTTKRIHETAQKYMGARSFLDTLSSELRSTFDFRWPDPNMPSNFLPNFFYGEDPNNPERKKLEFWVTAPDEIQILYLYPFYIHKVIYYFEESKESGKKVISKRIEPLDKKFSPIEGPVLEGNFDIEIEVIEGKVKLPLPEKVIVKMTIDGKYPLRKVIPIYEIKQTE